MPSPGHATADGPLLAGEGGVDVTLERGKSLIHTWQRFGLGVPEAAQRIGAFAREHAS